MSRQWEDLNRGEQQRALDTLTQLAGPAPRQQHEAQAQAALSKWARGQWWAAGYRHHDAATESWATARQRWRQGVRSGWPDVTVMVPGEPVAELRVGEQRLAPEPVRRTVAYMLAVELKRDALRPKRRAGKWWLDWATELESDDSWHIRPSEPTRHGLSARQAETLLLMHRCGWQTLVAYGWDEARVWLEERLG